MRILFALTVTSALLFGSGLRLSAALVQESLEVFPSTINLTSGKDRQTVVVRMVEGSGVHRDVTKTAKLTLENLATARLENGVVLPVADGETKLRVDFAGKSHVVPVKVSKSKEIPPVSFRLDVMPVFMKAECNRCHGAARGQDGFRLSLWGFDPEGDYHRLLRELPGRRVNLATPEASMILTKSDGSAPHTGGKRFDKNSVLYKNVHDWLSAGAPNDNVANLPTCTSLEILPKQLVLESPGQAFKMTVRAHYSDGTDRDVTDFALFLTSNESSAKVSNEGVITTGQRGEAFVMARFATHTVGSQVVVIPKGLKFEWPALPEKNYVDTFVHTKLKNLRMLPSDICSDETFMRRAYIDITGTLPTSAETTAFVAAKEAGKREKLIDTLLNRKEFVQLWALKWSELLQIRTEQNNQGSYKAVISYYKWIRDRLEQNVPVNEIARQLISASGSNLENPAANFYNLERDVLKLSEDTAQAFFGIRIQCAQCHNHPFDRWTMDDYRGFVAFFTQIGRKDGEDPRERIVFNTASGESRHPVDNKVIAPRFLGGDAPDCVGKDRRTILADWVASPENPWFPKHMANLVWAQYMGRGITEPVDDVRISNPAVNPELLEVLSKKLVEYQFDLKKLVRDICTSRTYQLTTRLNETNALDERNFAHATIRRMRAEVLLDCINQVCDAKDKFRGLPAGARSVEIADGKTTNYFLTTFGRTDRETICAREEVGPTLSQALHLINGATIEGKIREGGVIPKLVAQNMSPKEIVNELFLRCYSRTPTAKENAGLEQHMGVTETQKEVYHDVFWALMNGKEFLFNH